MSVAKVEHVLKAARGTVGVLPGAGKKAHCTAAEASRVSFGVQSLDDAFLKLLGRRHDSATARQAAAWAGEAGFNFNLDFMFGLPGQTLPHWESTLDQAVALGPDHLSCYLLTLDERVPMGRDVAPGRLVLPVDDDLAEMYTATQERPATAG